MKIAGLDQFFTRSNISDIQAKMEADISNTLALVSLDDYVKKSQLARLVILVSGIFFAIGLIVTLLTSFYMIAILPALAFGVMFIAIAQLRSYRKQWLIALNQIISFSKMSKLFFETKYENVQVGGKSEVDMTLVNSYRGEGIPRDATIKKKSFGPSFLINGIEVCFMFVIWKWYERSGKNRVEVNQAKFITYIPKVPKRWEGFALNLTPSSFLYSKGKELENEQFNKKFSYVHNDPVRLRILLTPFVQENFVNYFHLTSSYATHQINFLGNSFFSTKHAISGDPFNIDKIPMKKTSELPSIIFKEVLSDLEYIEEQITVVSSFREFIINR